MNDLVAGDRVGRFLLEQELGEGGMGTVFEAIDTILNRRVALKFLRTGKMDPEMLFRGSLRESRVLAELNHHNIVHLYDVGMHERRPYFVMELVRGKSLRVLCNAFGTLETFDALGVSVQIGEGLCAAHGAGIIHNDLKPENVMMTANPAGHVKLVDFGLSRTIERASTGTTGELIDGKGTPHYMAPELHRGERATEKSDVYSWGQITHEMLTGRFLFERRTGDVPSRREVGRLHLMERPISIVEIRGESLSKVEQIVFDMLAKHPEDRPTSREALGLLQRELARLEVELPELSDRTLTAEVSRPPIVQVVAPLGVEESGPRTEPQGTVRARITTVRVEPRPSEEAAPLTPISPVSPGYASPTSRAPVSSAAPVSISVPSPSPPSQPPVPSSHRVSARSPAPSSAPRVSENLRRVLTTQIGSAVRTSVAAGEGASVDAVPPTGGSGRAVIVAPGSREHARLQYMSTEPLEAAQTTQSSDRGGWTSSSVLSPELPTPPATPPPVHRTVTERLPPRPPRSRSTASRLWVGGLVGLTSAAAAFAVYLLAPSSSPSVTATSAPSTEPATTVTEPSPAGDDAGAVDGGAAVDASVPPKGAADVGRAPARPAHTATQASPAMKRPLSGPATVVEPKSPPPAGAGRPTRPPKATSSGQDVPPAPTSTLRLPFGKDEP